MRSPTVRPVDGPAIFRFEFHDQSDREHDELGEALRRAQELETFDDPLIQRDQIVFGQRGEVEAPDIHYSPVPHRSAGTLENSRVFVPRQPQVVAKGHRGDLQIVRLDRFSLPLKHTTDLGTLHCERVIERKRARATVLGTAALTVTSPTSV